MKESDKNMDQFVYKIMSESTLESPSIDFTSKVMAQVLAAQNSKIQQYKPLIATPIWVVILGCLVSLICYSSFGNVSHHSESDYSYLVNIPNLFSTFHFSKNTIYAILIVPFMILVQIPILKNYYEKKYQL
jgi:hypothetical protein